MHKNLIPVKEGDVLRIKGLNTFDKEAVFMKLNSSGKLEEVDKVELKGQIPIIDCVKLTK